MAVTGQQVFDIAMVLMDELDGAAINQADAGEYKFKALSILTILQAELLPKTAMPTVISDLSQNLSLTDRLCLMVLPYGLAAHLLLIEVPAAASYFNGRYEELRSKQPAEATPIIDEYDTLSGLR